MRACLLLAGLCLVGCSVDPGKNPDMVEVQGKVTVNSKPLTGVTVNFQPTGVGTQATMPVKDGSFKGSITPGKYTYYVTEGSNTASYKSVPSKYREGSLDRQIDIGAGQTLDLKLD